MAAIRVELWYSCNVLLSTLFSRWLVPNIITSVLPFLQLIISSFSACQLVSELKSSSMRFWITSIFLSAQKMTVSSAYITIPQCKRVSTASLKCRRSKRGPYLDPCCTAQYIGYRPDVVPRNDTCCFLPKR